MNWLEAALMILAVTACGSNSNNSNPQGAAVPQPVPMQVSALQTQCLQAAPHAAWWDNYQVQPYSTPINGPNAFPNGTICGCPPNTMPTCSAQGLVCVPMNVMNQNVAVWSWSYGQGAPGGFQPNYQFINPYNTWYGGGRGYDGDELPPIYPQNGVCPYGTMLDRDGDRCISIQPHRFGPRGPVAGPGGRPDQDDGPLRGQRGGMYAYTYTYGYASNSCSISSVAQLCDVIPGQPPINGMMCQPLAGGSPKGIWVQAH